MRKVAAILVVCAFGAPAFGAATSAQAKAPTIKVVVDHLDNPRGVSIGANGRVLVAEAGHGDPNGGKCANVTSGGVASKMCLGFTGAVTALQGATAKRILTKLPSVADPTGFSGFGPASATDVGGYVAVVMQGTMSSIPAAWKPWGTSTFAHVLLNTTPAIDLRAYENAHNPAHDDIESDPYSMAISGGGASAVIVDAGANDALLWKNNAVSTLAVFPPQMVPEPGSSAKTQQQSVPTSVVAMPDGSYLVGELTGWPYAVGSARIWKVVPGKAPTVWKKGFTNIAGLARGPDGSIYVSEITKFGLRAVGATQGGLFRIAPNGTVSEIPVPGLKWAGGVAVAKDGAIYVVNCSIGLPSSASPCRGQLLKVTLT